MQPVRSYVLKLFTRDENIWYEPKNVQGLSEFIFKNTNKNVKSLAKESCYTKTFESNVNFTEDLIGELAQQTILKCFTRYFVPPPQHFWSTWPQQVLVCFFLLSHTYTFTGNPSLLLCTTPASISRLLYLNLYVSPLLHSTPFLAACSATVFAYLSLFYLAIPVWKLLHLSIKYIL